MTTIAETSARDRQGWVLYVDDHPVNVQLMQALFELRTGFQLLHAASGRQALAMAFETRPALLLLDLRLPDVHGSQLLGPLRQRHDWDDVPAVAVTADHDFDVIEAGFCEMWKKPLDLRVVLQRLQALTAPHRHPPAGSRDAGPPAPAMRRPYPAPPSLHGPGLQ